MLADRLRRARTMAITVNMARAVAAVGPLIVGNLVGPLGSVPAAGRLITCVFVVGPRFYSFGKLTGQPTLAALIGGRINAALLELCTVLRFGRSTRHRGAA